MPEDAPAVEIENLTVRYGDGPDLLSKFSLTLDSGECAAIYGASGCGKSTLLHCICGLIPRSIPAEMTGTVRLFGRPVEEYPRHELVQCIGIVFQNPDTQLFCDTVEDEIAFGLENICLSREEMALRVEEILAVTGLDKYRMAAPKLLSGGQKQLVVLAAVLALRPKILLMDEAFSQLDERSRGLLLNYVLTLRNNGLTMVLVDHDPKNMSFARKVVRLGEQAGVFVELYDFAQQRADHSFG